MPAQIQLSEVEVSRLERILSVEDLERQKRMAYPFWIVAVVIFISAQIAVFLEPLLCIALLPLSFVAAMIGMARYGYYKLFRLLQYQNSVIELLRQNVPTEG